MAVTVAIQVRPTGASKLVSSHEYALTLPDGTVATWWSTEAPESQEAEAGRRIERFGAFQMTEAEWRRVAFVLRVGAEHPQAQLAERIERRAAQPAGLLGEHFFQRAEEVCWVREAMVVCGLPLPDEGVR